MPEAAIRRAVFVVGRVVLDKKVLEVQNVLLDSGATHASYISFAFIQKYKHYFAPHLNPDSYQEGSLFLADGVTKGTTHGSVRLEVELVGNNGELHSGHVVFQIFEMKTNEIIIGLPELVRVFSTLYLKKITDAISEAESDNFVPVTKQNMLSTVQEFVSSDIPYGSLITNPWSQDYEVIAPEELSTPDPCSFPDVLHYMEMSVEDAIKEYMDMVDDNKHVLPEFANCTKVKELLRTKGLLCFVPQNWTGINGLEPLELTWRDTLPPKMKPGQRQVNPRLLDCAKTEFDRLKQYMYVESNSDICSPLVIAPKATKPFIRYCGDYVKVNLHIETGHQPIPDVQKSLEKIWIYKVFVDLDMVNSFHQVKLAEKTSHRLSVQTPWGQVRPLFMPEGIGPAS